MQQDFGTTTRAGEPDPLGLDDLGGVRERLGRLVPQSLARRGLAVEVESDGSTYRAEESIPISIEIRNRLPLPVSLETDGKRLWGWSVDGHVGASDEPLYASAAPRRLDLAGFESLRIRREWDGRIRRRGSPTRWEPVGPGDHEIRAFVPADGGPVTGSMTVTIEP